MVATLMPHVLNFALLFVAGMVIPRLFEQPGPFAGVEAATNLSR
jgi:hypothetical protein